MEVAFHRPSYPVALIAESFVYYKGLTPVHELDRFLPDGQINIVFDLGDQPQYIYDNLTLLPAQTCRRVWFSGIRDQYITIPSGRHAEMFIINVRTGYSKYFTQTPAFELANTVLDADLILGNDIESLRQNLMQQTNAAQRFRLAEIYCGKLVANAGSANPVVDYALQQLSVGDAIQLKKLSAKIGYSQKQFISIFKDAVGLTPKAYMRVMRFQAALSSLASYGEKSMAGLAIDCGYFDQAHFNHDFKKFSGFTPTIYMEQDHQLQNYVAVR